MLEPSITVTNLDLTAGIAQDPVDNRLNILCPVISPSGPLELTRVSGPSEFKRLYFGGNNISANDGASAVFARSLVAQAPIWIKRGARNTMRGGISSASGETVYVDENLQPISGTMITLTPPSEGDSGFVTVKNGFETWIADKSKVVKEDNLVYTSEDLSSETWVKNSTQKKLNTVLTFEGEVPTSDSLTILIGDYSFTLPPESTNFDGIFGSLIEKDMVPQAFEGEGNYIKDGDSSPTEVTSLKWVAPIGISVIGADSEKLKIDTSATSNVYCVTLKTEEENEETWKLTSPKVEFEYGSTSYAYYAGSYEGEAIVRNKITDIGSPTYSEFMSALVHALASDFHAGTCGVNKIILPNITSVIVEGVECSTSVVNTVVDSERFAIISRFPCATPLFSAKLTDKKDGSYVVSVSYQDISEEWTFSFDASRVDGYGISIYYPRVNDESELIYIVELNGEAVTSGLSKSFGNEVTSDYSDVNDVVSALESIYENEEAEGYFDFILDAGLIDTTLTSTVQSLCSKYYSYYPASCMSSTSASDHRARRSAVGENWRSNYIAQTQRDTTVDIGSVVLPASFYYTRRRVELGNTAQEFMALYGSQGNIGMINPIEKWTKTQREDFLDSQILTLKRDPNLGYCLNDNLTCYSTPSYLQEDGIALMVNKISQVADAYGKGLISKYHTRALESMVQQELTLSLNSRLRVGTDNGPISISVVCNSSNNPQSLINQRKIRIDIYVTFTRSIRDVLVFSSIMPTSE